MTIFVSNWKMTDILFLDKCSSDIVSLKMILKSGMAHVLYNVGGQEIWRALRVQVEGQRYSLCTVNIFVLLWVAYINIGIHYLQIMEMVKSQKLIRVWEPNAILPKIVRKPPAK